MTVIRGQKNNFGSRFKLGSVTTYHLSFVMKNDMFTKFLQHFYNKFYMVDCYLLLLVDKNNFSD